MFVKNPDRRKKVSIKIGRFSVQIPPGTRPGLGTQPRYEALGNVQFELVKMQLLTLDEWGRPPSNGSKMAVGQPNRSVFKKISLFIEK